MESICPFCVFIKHKNIDSMQVPVIVEVGLPKSNGVYFQPTTQDEDSWIENLVHIRNPESTFKLQSIPWYDNFQVSGAVPEHLE